MENNLNSILSGMAETSIVATDQVILVDPDTRQLNIPGVELVFGVEGDASSERKYFQFPRYVSNGIDLASCFLRVNYRNAKGETDFYLVDDVTVSGDSVVFSWEIHPKVVAYKGQVRFVVCAVGPDLKTKWHTTLGTGLSLEGQEVDAEIEAATEDGVAQLIAMVEAQTAAVKSVGAEQSGVVRAAAEAAQTAAVAEVEAKGVNTLASIPADYTALGEAVDALTKGRARAIVCEAEGDAISVSDASDMPMQGLRVFGRSTQDGTPTPNAPVEIKSVEKPVVTMCGKNLVPPTTDTFTGQGITSSPAVTGTVVLNGTATAEMSRVISKGIVLAPGRYTLSAHGLNAKDVNHDRVFVTGSTGSVLVNYVMTGKPATFTLAEATTAQVAIVFAAGSAYSNTTISIQMELGEVATEYEPYKGAKTVSITNTLPGIPVTSGGNYTDGDGQQWICDEVDLERGVYVQRITDVTFDGSEAWYISAAQIGQGTRFDLNSKTEPVALTTDCISNRFINAVNASVEACWVLAGSPAFRLITEKASTVAELQSYLASNPTVIQYAMLEPIETPLSETELAAYRALHTNKPNTTILNDGGAHMAVAYAADTKMYIDNKIAALVGNN